MRLTLLIVLIAAAVGLVAAAPASAASAFTIRGAGWGHGVGMSQYGAAGYAKHGWTHEQILTHYFTGTQIGTVPAATVVRVLLQSPQKATFSGADAAGDQKLDPTARYSVRTISGGRVELLDSSGASVTTSDAPLKVSNADDKPILLAGGSVNGLSNGRYRGSFEFRPGTLGEILAVNVVGLEQYVAGVIGNEAIPSWPIEALEAQAVASRSYGVATSRNGKGGWDLYPDTRSQVYKGIAGENPNTTKATTLTAGQIVTYAGKPATTFFFSTSGGETESIENAFVGSAPLPYLKGVDDPYDDESPYHRWGPIVMSRSAAGAKLGSLVKGSFKRIKVLQRGVSPRIVRAQVIGTGGATDVTGATLRSKFGLRDSWMTFNSATAEVQPPSEQPAPTPATPTTPAPASGGASAGGAAAGARAARVTRSRVVGAAYPARPGTDVVLQRRVHGTWVRAASTHLGTTRRYKVYLPGPGRYRVVIGGLPGPTVRSR
jgi:SpoIID/LytB domain protein